MLTNHKQGGITLPNYSLLKLTNHGEFKQSYSLHKFKD